jgi:serine/threonine-protein kinase
MVYVPGAADSGVNRVLVLVDRNGIRKQIQVPSAPYLTPRFSPDGKQLALGTDDGKEAAVWVYDLSGATSMRKLTFGGSNRFPLWSRDGKFIVFSSDREGDPALFRQQADGNGAAERLAQPEGKKAFFSPDSWSLDGKTLLFSTVSGLGAAFDNGIWSVVTGERDAKPSVLIDTPKRDDSASVSPDGHWIAYESNELGQIQIYVQSFPSTKGKYQITTTGGAFPVWSQDGKQLFFIQFRTGGGGPASGHIFSVDVQTQPGFTFGKPTPLPIENFLINGGPGLPRGYDISPDGKQFVVMFSPQDSKGSAAEQINVTLNWVEELKQRLGAK